MQFIQFTMEEICILRDRRFAYWEIDFGNGNENEMNASMIMTLTIDDDG